MIVYAAYLTIASLLVPILLLFCCFTILRVCWLFFFASICFFSTFRFRFLIFLIFCFRSNIRIVRLSSSWCIKCCTRPHITWDILVALDTQIVGAAFNSSNLLAPVEKSITFQVFPCTKVTADAWSTIGWFICGYNRVMACAKHSVVDYDTVFTLWEFSIESLDIASYFFWLIVKIHGFSLLNHVVSHNAISAEIKVTLRTLPAFYSSSLIKICYATVAKFLKCPSITSPTCKTCLLPFCQFMFMFANA